LPEVEDRLLPFQARYEVAAKPFQWTFTRQDLMALLAKLDTAPNHEAVRSQGLAA
jgi:hypothetical protein